MGETAEERQRRLAERQRLARWVRLNSGYGIYNWWTNPCEEIMLTPSQLRANPLVKFTKFKFKFSDEV